MKEEKNKAHTKTARDFAVKNMSSHLIQTKFVHSEQLEPIKVDLSKSYKKVHFFWMNQTFIIVRPRTKLRNNNYDKNSPAKLDPWFRIILIGGKGNLE